MFASFELRWGVMIPKEEGIRHTGKQEFLSARKGYTTQVEEKLACKTGTDSAEKGWGQGRGGRTPHFHS